MVTSSRAAWSVVIAAATVIAAPRSAVATRARSILALNNHFIVVAMVMVDEKSEELFANSSAVFKICELRLYSRK